MNDKKDYEKYINESVTALASELGYRHVEPNIVQPAGAYFDMLGDQLRRRLFIVQDSMRSGGVQDFVLRPEFTICIAQDYLNSLKADSPLQTAKFSYSGPVFRANINNRQFSQFNQTGIEIFAAKDTFKADIETLEYALRTLDRLKIDQLTLKMGDYHLFFSLVENLDISDIWRKKLKQLFLAHDSVDKLREQLAKPQFNPVNQDKLAFLKAIEGLEIDDAQSLVENVLSFSGIDLVGGRSAAQIAKRFLDQAALSATPVLPDHILQILYAFFAINDCAEVAVEQLDQLNIKHTLKLDADIDQLQKRFDAVDALNIKGYSKTEIQFSTVLGRGFDYYTGMVFEIIDNVKRVDAPLIAGGRYDALAEQLGGETQVNAVGASLWNARIAQLITVNNLPLGKG